MEIKNIGLEELSLSEQENVNGGFCCFWDMFWSGMKVGLGVGGAIGVAYYFA